MILPLNFLPASGGFSPEQMRIIDRGVPFLTVCAPSRRGLSAAGAMPSASAIPGARGVVAPLAPAVASASSASASASASAGVAASAGSSPSSAPSSIWMLEMQRRCARAWPRGSAQSEHRVPGQGRRRVEVRVGVRVGARVSRAKARVGARARARAEARVRAGARDRESPGCRAAAGRGTTRRAPQR